MTVGWMKRTGVSQSFYQTLFSLLPTLTVRLDPPTLVSCMTRFTHRTICCTHFEQEAQVSHRHGEEDLGSRTPCFARSTCFEIFDSFRTISESVCSFAGFPTATAIALAREVWPASLSPSRVVCRDLLGSSAVPCSAFVLHGLLCMRMTCPSYQIPRYQSCSLGSEAIRPSIRYKTVVLLLFGVAGKGCLTLCACVGRGYPRVFARCWTRWSSQQYQSSTLTVRCIWRPCQSASSLRVGSSFCDVSLSLPVLLVE
jgi:hypothetical protein